MMWKRFLERSWKGFVIRYLVILLALLALNYMYMNRDQLFPTDPVVEQEKEIELRVAYQVNGDELHLDFKLTNFELSLENMGRKNSPNQGHIHLYVDGEKKAKIFEPQYVFKGLPPGSHQIKIELAHNNHEPIGINEVFSIDID